MEQLFKLALWMFCLSGFLQAIPLKNGASDLERCYNLIDLDLEHVSSALSCEQHVKFTAPKKVMKQCYGAAMTMFVKELERSSNSCTGDIDRPLDIINALDLTTENLESSSTAAPTECNWEKTTYEDFVKSFETFLQQLNSHNC